MKSNRLRLSEAFERYYERMYPLGDRPERRDQITDAFIAGAATVLDAFNDNAANDGELTELLSEIYTELRSYLMWREFGPKKKGEKG